MSLRLDAGPPGRRRRGLDRRRVARPGARPLYVLLGPTLAGKTSLMRLMAGLDRPTSGRVLVDGVDVTGVSVRQRSVAMVYQQFINYPSLTAYDNIASPLRLQGARKAEIDRKVRETARCCTSTICSTACRPSCRAASSSALAIARALVKEARLLLLDEPLVNLDYKLREELRAELRDLFARQRTTVVYATTEPLEALIMGGDVIVMDEGRVLQTGPTVEVYHRPGSLRVAARVQRPADEHAVRDRGRRASRGAGRSGATLPLAATSPAAGAGRTRWACAPTTCLDPPPRRGRPRRSPPRVELAEISGSETFVHVQQRRPAGWCRRRACTSTRWASR